MIHTVVPDGALTFLRKVSRLGGSVNPELVKAIIVTQRVQSWFQRRRGRAMERLPCHAHGSLQPFTIWVDGSYRCLRCLFIQAQRGGEADASGEMPSDPKEFVGMWEEYCRRYESDGWPQAAAAHQLKELLPAPEACCIPDICPTCKVIRPHVRKPDDKTRCLYCLVRYVRKHDFRQVAVPRHSTRERLDYAARLAAAMATRLGP